MTCDGWCGAQSFGIHNYDDLFAVEDCYGQVGEDVPLPIPDDLSIAQFLLIDPSAA